MLAALFALALPTGELACPLSGISVGDAVHFCSRLVQAHAAGLTNDTLVLDVGAAGGLEAVVANRLGHPSLSFECRADEYALVSKVLAQRAPGARLLHACVSDHAGLTTIYRAGHASSMHQRVVSATWQERALARREKRKEEPSAVVTLDDVMADMGPNVTVGFLRMDVQGNEAQVFAGAKRTILEHRPFLMYEYAFDANLTGHVQEHRGIDIKSRARALLFDAVPGAEQVYWCSVEKDSQDCFCTPRTAHARPT